MDLFGATQARYYEDKALNVSIAHPNKPVETLRRLMKAALGSWRVGQSEVWRDSRAFRRWLESRGMMTKAAEEETK